MTLNAWTGLQDPATPQNIREGEPYNDPQFEELARTYGVWGTAQSALCAEFWKAARRAQVVPQGWKLVPDEVPDEMVDAAIEAYIPFGDMRFSIVAALAAAPQPPEAERRVCNSDECGWIGLVAECVRPKHDASTLLCPECHETTELAVAAEAAPVQMPEADGYIMDSLPNGRLEYKRGPLSQMDFICNSTMPVYEYGTVRQLLAAHGIGKDKA